MANEAPQGFALVIDGIRYSRFESVMVDMSLESIGFTFQTSAVVPYGQPFRFKRHAACELYIGSERLFGAILEQPGDGYQDGGSSTQLVGGSKTMALAYSHVENGLKSFRDLTLLEIVTKLAAPHGISVSAMPAADMGKKFGVFKIQAGETSVDAIARACSERTLLCFTSDGDSLTIGRPMAGPAAYTLPSLARKAKQARIGGDSTQVGSQYTVVSGGSLDGKNKRGYTLPNPSVTIVRPIVIHATRGRTLADMTAQAGRILHAREGRALYVTMRVASWTDERGKAWRTGTLVRVKDDRLRLGPMQTMDEVLVLSDVSLRRGGDGDWADITLKRVNSYIEED